MTEAPIDELRSLVVSAISNAAGYVDSQALCRNEVPPVHALAVADLLLPDVVVYRDGLFLRSQFDKLIVDSWFEATNGDIKSVESVVNSIFIEDVFLTSNDKAVISTLTSMFYYAWLMWIPFQSGRPVEVYHDVGEDGNAVTFVSIEQK